MTTATATQIPTRSNAPSKPTKPSTPVGRWLALSMAEGLQFVRNRLLMFLALVFPVGMPIAMYLVFRGSSTTGFAEATAMEMFFIFAMLFVEFYAVLSMATTRRDEKVLKRLRTGELRDGEILTAISTPAAVLTVLLTAVFAVLLLVLGSPMPVNILPVLVALVLGIAISAAFAFLTTIITQNAEAAQMTSMPVMVLALMSQGSIRDVLPENVADVLDRTPFALMSDLSQLGWTGTTTQRVSAGESTLEAGAVLSETLPLMGILAVWTIVLVWAAAKYMKWETNR